MPTLYKLVWRYSETLIHPQVLKGRFGVLKRFLVFLISKMVQNILLLGFALVAVSRASYPSFSAPQPVQSVPELKYPQPAPVAQYQPRPHSSARVPQYNEVRYTQQPISVGPQYRPSYVSAPAPVQQVQYVRYVQQPAVQQYYSYVPVQPVQQQVQYVQQPVQQEFQYVQPVVQQNFRYVQPAVQQEVRYVQPAARQYVHRQPVQVTKTEPIEESELEIASGFNQPKPVQDETYPIFEAPKDNEYEYKTPATVQTVHKVSAPAPPPQQTGNPYG